MKRLATLFLAMAAAIASLPAFAQSRPAQPPSWLTRLYGVPGPKVNFGSCQAPVPAVQLTPGSLAFGSVAAPNVSPSQRVTLTNVGNNVLQVFSIDTSSNQETADLFAITANTCPPSLAPGGSCTIDVAYDAGRDPGMFGPIPGSLNVFTNAPSSVSVVSLSATQVAQPVPQFDYLPVGGLDFGFVPLLTTSAPLAVSIKNVGGAPMPTVFVGTGSGDFAVASTNCGVVPAGGSCTASITFTPSTPGLQQSFVDYQYTHPIFGTVFESVPIEGQGLSATADIAVSPGAVDFGTITVASGWSSGVDVTNTGATALIINTFGIPAHFTINAATTCVTGPPGLAPGTRCNIAFDADTSVPGTFSSTLTIDNSSITNPIFNVPVSSRVVPDFTISPSFHDFGNVFVNPPLPPSVVVTLTNNDPIPESVSFASQIFGTNFTVGPGGPSPCPGVLAPAQTCTFVITFAPQAPGGYFGPTIAIRDGAGSETWYDYSAIGVGVQNGPNASFAQSFLDFGSVVAGSAPVTLTADFTNVGDQPINVVSYTTSPPFSAAEVIGFCPPGYPVIQPGESCRLAVTFTPPGAPNSFGDNVSVDDSVNGAVGLLNVFAFTTSGPSPAADFFPQSLDFGNVGVNMLSAPQVVSFGNTGSAPFNITAAPSITGPFLLASACPASLAPGDCCSLTVTYAPPPPGGSDAGTITIQTDVGGMTTFNVGLSGVGVPPPSLSVAPITLPTTRQGFVTGPVAYAVKNVGVTPITLTNLTLSGPAEISSADPTAMPPQPSSFLPCIGANLAVGASCAVQFWFAPVALGTYNATFTVTFSGGTANPAVIPVVATAVPPTSPDIALSSDVVSFNGVVINTGASSRLVITSTGTSPLNVTAITALGEGFSQSNDCLRPLDPGTSCSVDIGFRPGALRAFQGDLVVEYEPAGNFRLVRLLGMGINEPKPRILLSATALVFNAQSVGSRSAEQALVVRNIGSAPLDVSRVTSSAGFASEHGCGLLAPGTSCTVRLRFAPIGAGPVAGVVAVTSNDPDRPNATASLSGVACRTPGPSANRNIATGCQP